jgi:tetratricopeptide (TPR) repeat protein
VVGDFDSSRRSIDEALARAAEAGDEAASARARLESVILNTLVGGTNDLIGRALSELADITAVLERLGDRAGLSQALGGTARLRFYAGDCAGAVAAYERAILLAREQGMRRETRDWQSWWLAAKRFGATPVPEVIVSAQQVIEEFRSDGMPVVNPQIFEATARTMDGQLEAGRALLEQAMPIAGQLGVLGPMMIGMEGAVVFGLAGDFDAAVEVLRGSYALGAEIGETGWRSTVGAELAEALAISGRTEEAESVITEVYTFVSPDDFEPQARLRWVRARLLAGEGRFEEAERLARDAVAIVAATDWIDHRGEAHAALGSVLAAANRVDEGAAERRTALEFYGQKGNVVRAREMRELLGL